ncbi:hypothetical protein PG999_001864 [Apiospora kogelbergensis]|uniref:Uncharacterized protein n=1 Tax=Apiospora kogelbergensis TaxID=1337665 RepID=A0AAW0R6S4_9PEZI
MVAPDYLAYNTYQTTSNGWRRELDRKNIAFHVEGGEGHFEVVIEGVRPLQLAPNVEGSEIPDSILHLVICEARQHVQPVVNDECFGVSYHVSVEDVDELTFQHDATEFARWESHHAEFVNFGYGGGYFLIPVELSRSLFAIMIWGLLSDLYLLLADLVIDVVSRLIATALGVYCAETIALTIVMLFDDVADGDGVGNLFLGQIVRDFAAGVGVKGQARGLGSGNSSSNDDSW